MPRKFTKLFKMLHFNETIDIQQEKKGIHKKISITKISSSPLCFKLYAELLSLSKMTGHLSMSKILYIDVPDYK